MRKWLGWVLVFALGAAVGTVMLLGEGRYPLLVSRTLVCLTPGLPLGFLALGGIPWSGWSGLDWIFPACAVINGVAYVLVWKLVPLALRGQRLPAASLAVGACLWLAWNVQWLTQHRPIPEPPPAPIDLASPVAGRWEGVLHASDDDLPAIFVGRPHTDGSLEGYLNINHVDMGPFDEGSWAGDSLSFDILGFKHFARRNGNEMSMWTWVTRDTQVIDLHFVSADTLRPEPATPSP